MATKKKIPKKETTKASSKSPTKRASRVSAKKSTIVKKAPANLATSHKSLLKKYEALKADAAVMKKNLADLAIQLEARTKQRDSLATEKNAANAQLSTLTTERDKLKAHITELETRLGKSQVAREEILNAERQLEAIKDMIKIPLR